MSDNESPPRASVSIQELIQIRALLGNEEQEPSSKTTQILEALDSVLLDFANSLTKGN